MAPNDGNKIPEHPIYVALDLGSDSMGACCETAEHPLNMIPLQVHSHAIAGAEVDPANPVMLLKDEKGNKTPYLRTRIGFREPLLSPFGDETLPAGHEKAEFVNANGVYGPNQASPTLFRFFHKKDDHIKLMPNPKLIFQSGCARAVPELELDETLCKTLGKPLGTQVRYPPAELLCHLTTQILLNFVLRSSMTVQRLQGRGIYDVRLALTVPNVYSLAHARQLRDFVRTHIGCQVTLVYESDALAYYLKSNAASKRTRDFYKKYLLPLDEAEKEIRIVAIDVGRGTTDVSLIRIQKAIPGVGKPRHCVLARSGVCSGGQELTHIFARYYNKRMALAFSELQQPSPFNFNFTDYSPEGTLDQTKVNRELENLIEAVKAGIDKNYQLRLRPPTNAAQPAAATPEETTKRLQEEHIKALVKALVGEEKTGVPPAVPPAVQAKLLESFLLPFDLTNPSGQPPRPRRLLSRTKEEPDPTFKHVHDLRREIEQYVAHNTAEMLNRMQRTAQRRERAHLGPCTEKVGNVLDSACTFVLVAGQASQFGPIRAAIVKWFDGKIRPEHIHFEIGADAKRACCVGAVAYLQSNVEHLNPTEFFGTYGLLRRVQGSGYWIPADTIKLLKDGTFVLERMDQAACHFVFVAREVDEGYPALGDGYTALIDYLAEGNQPLRIEVGYDRAGETIRLGNREMTAVGPGYAMQAIEPKIWPIIPPPEDALQ